MIGEPRGCSLWCVDPDGMQQALIAMGVSADASNATGQTALHVAAIDHSDELVKVKRSCVVGC